MPDKDDMKHKCTLDECNNIISLYREFCSKECRDAFFRKYLEEQKK